MATTSERTERTEVFAVSRYTKDEHYEFSVAPSPDYPGKWRIEMRHVKGEHRGEWDTACMGNYDRVEYCRNRFVASEIWRYERGDYEILDPAMKAEADRQLAVRAEAVAREAAERSRREEAEREARRERDERNVGIAARVATLKGRKGTVAVGVIGGGEQRIAATIYGDGDGALAIHERIDASKHKTGYAVTVVALGMRIGGDGEHDHFPTLDQARACVAQLAGEIDFAIFRPGRQKGKAEAQREAVARVRAAVAAAHEYRKPC